ncbi:group III truncated hemoglobin [Zoogloea sp.]|uniref:group III truncated hemoglobin n=1 Tax=Zoogloea sp. TaxID=49181 RepID=UPI0035B3FF3A
MSTPEQDAARPTEAQIQALVHGFYGRAREDALLGPVFEAEVAHWGEHLRVICDFWSRTLCGTERYTGSPYPVHVRLPVEPAHFARWLELFQAAAREFLPGPAAEQAMAKAELMARSFQAGMFFTPRKDG